MRREIATASGCDAFHHEEDHERVAEQEPDGDERATFRVECEDGARGSEGEENDHARSSAEPPMDRAPALQRARHEEDAERQRDERRRHVDTERREPERGEAHGELLDRERRELAKVEVDKARRDDERGTERHHDEERDTQAVGANAIPHAR